MTAIFPAGDVHDSTCLWDCVVSGTVLSLAGHQGERESGESRVGPFTLDKPAACQWCDPSFQARANKAVATTLRSDLRATEQTTAILEVNVNGRCKWWTETRVVPEHMHLCLRYA